MDKKSHIGTCQVRFRIEGFGTPSAEDVDALRLSIHPLLAREAQATAEAKSQEREGGE